MKKALLAIWRNLRQVIISVLLLVGAALIAIWLTSSRPPVEKKEVKEKAIVVSVFVAHPSDEQVVLTAYGTVEEHRRLQLSPEVSGKIVEQSKELTIGGTFEEGEVLLKIDPRDYQTVLEEAEAGLSNAEFELELEQGRQRVAEREWELLSPSVRTGEMGKSLALREPQIEAKQASLEAAQARRDKAQLDLERTVLRAPFNALVLEEHVELGQVIGPQSPVATLVATDEYRVRVSIPAMHLDWVNVPHDDAIPGATAWVVQEFGNREEVRRAGEVVSILGDLDPQGRMARILVAVKDPLGLEDWTYADTPLLLGSYVKVYIEGPTLEGVYRLPRTTVREGDQVWIKNKEERLEIRSVHIIYSYDDHVLVDEGIEEGDRIIDSQIPVPAPGTLLRELESNRAAG